MEKLDASDGPIEETMFKPNVPEEPPEEQPIGNGLHLYLERMGPKMVEGVSWTYS